MVSRIIGCIVKHSAAWLTALLLAPTLTLGQTGTTLYNFCPNGGNCPAGPDGAYPECSLTADGAGNFFGTTYSGGTGSGTVFELSPDGLGGWTESIVYNFTGGTDGAAPWFSNVIFDKAGNLYGTLKFGGYGLEDGYGVVYELSPVGGAWAETVLYTFLGGADGGYPVNGLIMDAAGNLYGKTMIGGANNTGTIFELSPSAGTWVEKVLYSIDAGYSGLTMDTAGNIYSTSMTSVFELSPRRNGNWKSKTLHTFAGSHDGSYPAGTVSMDPAGNLYGTTADGGEYGHGTVYVLRPQRHGAWKEKILYSFDGITGGEQPWAGVVLDSALNIYGSTLLGPQAGVIYELVRSATGAYSEQILWTLSGPGAVNCYGTLAMDSEGNLYGTTEGGGPNKAGSIFEVTP